MANIGYPQPVLTVKKSRDPWDVYQKVHGELQRRSAAPILERARESKAGMAQSLISRGLYGTTVFDNLRQGIDRGAAQDLSGLYGGTAAQAMGLVPQMTPPPYMDPANARMLGYVAGSGGMGDANFLQGMMPNMGGQGGGIGAYPMPAPFGQMPGVSPLQGSPTPQKVQMSGYETRTPQESPYQEPQLPPAPYEERVPQLSSRIVPRKKKRT